MMPKIILFDAYGTLFNINSEDPALVKLLGEKKTTFLNTWRDKLLEFSWLTALSGQWIPFEEVISKALAYVSLKFAIHLEDIEPILMKLYRNPVLFEYSFWLFHSLYQLHHVGLLVLEPC